MRLAQVVWVAMAIAGLGLTIASVPSYFAALHRILPTHETPDFGSQLTASANGSDLVALGLSIDFYARFSVVVALASYLLFVLVGLIIFLRRANDRVALVAAYALILAPIAINSANVDTLPATWDFPVNMIKFLGEISIILFFYVFPSGSFAPRWTRWAFVSIVLYWLLDVFGPTSTFSSFTSILFSLAGFIFFLAIELSVVVAQVVRYRRVSTPRQRQQSKWVVYALALWISGAMTEILLLFVILPNFTSLGALVYMVGNLIQVCLIALFPISIAIAILRSQLWDIDTLINRTLVYGLLTGILALVYFGSVLLFDNLAGHLAGRVAGQVSSTPIIVVSTLLIAALFQPLRRRIQFVIDRRFYRRRYDAAHTIADFSGLLRGSVDLSEVTDQLLAVVDTTMQPAHFSLWLSARDTRHAG